MHNKLRTYSDNRKRRAYNLHVNANHKRNAQWLVEKLSLGKHLSGYEPNERFCLISYEAIISQLLWLILYGQYFLARLRAKTCCYFKTSRICDMLYFLKGFAFMTRATRGIDDCAKWEPRPHASLLKN